jgi:hypothetical protein
MTKRLPCPPAPGPLGEYAERFDDRLGTLAQRRGFWEYLQGLLLPRDRHKMLAGLVGTEPIVGAQAPSAQRLQFFLSESPWDAEAINRRRLELLVNEPPTAPHEGGVLVIEDSGDRKAGTKTAHVARQYLGSIGKVDGGIVALTGLRPTIGSTPHFTLSRTRRPNVWRRARPIRTSGRSLSLRSSWSMRPATPGAPSARSWPTASAARTPPSRVPSPRPACRTSWR